MASPVLHVIAGPNGAGKTTFVERVLAPSSLEFVNADHIAAERWPDGPGEHAYEAAQAAQLRREQLMEARRSFVTETVFSHESKVGFVLSASRSGYIVVLHVVIVPEDFAVARVEDRVSNGGHAVPEDKIRSRHRRLWGHVAAAVRIADQSHVYDNTSASTPFRHVAQYRNGLLVRQSGWPAWAPPELVNL